MSYTTDENTKNMNLTVVTKWDVLDRKDGIEIRTKYGDGRVSRENWHDDDARELAETILSIIEEEEENRPVREGEHVR